MGMKNRAKIVSKLEISDKVYFMTFGCKEEAVAIKKGHKIKLVSISASDSVSPIKCLVKNRERVLVNGNPIDLNTVATWDEHVKLFEEMATA